MTQLMVNKLATLVNCDPQKCTMDACPCYNTVEKKCDARRILQTVETILEEKFEKVKVYKPNESESKN